MRTRLALIAATMAAGLTVATPAAAQGYYDAPRYDSRAGYGYDHGYGYRADVRQLHYQIAEMRRDIHRFDRRGLITPREARKLDNKAVKLQRRIARMGHYGMNRGEWMAAQRGIANLHREIRHDLRDRGNGRDDRRWRKDRRYDRGDHDGDRRWDRRRDRWDD